MEENKWRVLWLFENAVVSVFSPNLDEMTSRKECIMRFTIFIFQKIVLGSANKSRRMKWEGHVAWFAVINTYKILDEAPEGKRSFVRPRRRFEGNVKIDLRKIRLEDVDSSHMAHDGERMWAVVNTVVNILYNIGNFSTIRTYS